MTRKQDLWAVTGKSVLQLDQMLRHFALMEVWLKTLMLQGDLSFCFLNLEQIVLPFIVALEHRPIILVRTKVARTLVRWRVFLAGPHHVVTRKQLDPYIAVRHAMGIQTTHTISHCWIIVAHKEQLMIRSWGM